MITITCDACTKDLTPEAEAWSIQMNEYKKGGNQLILHLCTVCMKDTLGVIETLVKSQSKTNGEA